MHVQQKLYTTTVCFLIASLASCDGTSDADYSSGSYFDASLGATEMKRCVILSGDTIKMDTLVLELSGFASNNGLKFLDDRPSGRNGTYLQKDAPYVVLDHAFYSQRQPPEHMFISFRSPHSTNGKIVEDAFFSFVEGQGSTRSCGDFQAGISPGWRLPD